MIRRFILACVVGAMPLAAQNPTNPRFPQSAALGPQNPYATKTSHADTLRG